MLRLLGPSALTILLLAAAGCAKPAAAYRDFVLPPVPPPRQEPSLPEPPPPVVIPTGAEEPPPPAAEIPKLTETEFQIRKAEARMQAGRRALAENRLAGARLEFDRAIGALLGRTPEEPSEAAELAARLDQISAGIYRLDRDHPVRRQAPSASDGPSFRPELTFPIDPAHSTRVQDLILTGQDHFPLDLNDAVLEYIRYFSAGQGRKVLVNGLRRSGRYKTLIQDILEQEGLPRELVYVVQAESKFDPTAVSARRCCVGLWQFSRERGPEYGLERDALIDLRRDPELSTRAAARHLADLYQHYGDWPLALAAHNCGPGCIDDAILHTGYADYWELRRLRVLPRETANFVPQIIAFAIMSAHPERYGLSSVEIDEPVTYESLELPSPTHLDLAAAAVGRSVEELKRLNPALLKDRAPAGYRFHVPAGTLASLEAALAVVPLHRRESWRVHRMIEGDSFESLAGTYKVAERQIRAANLGMLPAPGEFAAIPPK